MSAPELSAKRRQILRTIAELNNPQGSSPTEIGLHCGHLYCNASSWACSGLKPMVGTYVNRVEGRRYVLTEAGQQVHKV